MDDPPREAWKAQGAAFPPGASPDTRAPSSRWASEVLPPTVSDVLVAPATTIRDTMKNIDLSGMSMACIVDDSRKLLGITTDGDIRRAIIRGISLDTPIQDIMNKRPMTLSHSQVTEAEIPARVKKELVAARIPVVNEQGQVADIVFHTDYGITSMLRQRSLAGKRVKKVLVIGGAGYLGTILVEKLLQRGYTVKVLDSLLYGDEPLKPFLSNPNFSLIVADVRHISNVTKAIQGVDAVIHLAGIVGDPACALSPTETLEQNFLATALIANVCKYYQVNRLLFASSCSVYGISDEIVDEQSLPNPISLYARDKLHSEAALLQVMDGNFAPTILRMGTLYGWSHRPRFDLVINLLAAMALVEKKITIFGGGQWRPFVHVEDAADAYIAALEAPIQKVKGEIFNVGSDENNFKIIEIGKMLKAMIPEANLEVTPKATDERDYRVSFKKISAVLGFRPTRTLQEEIIAFQRLHAQGKLHDFRDAKYNNIKYLELLAKAGGTHG